MLISHYEHFGARGWHDLEPGDCDARRFGAIGPDLDALVTGSACYRFPSEAATQAAKSRDPWQRWFSEDLLLQRLLTFSFPQRLECTVAVRRASPSVECRGAAILANVFANLEAERFASAHRAATSQECVEHAVLSFRFFQDAFHPFPGGARLSLVLNHRRRYTPVSICAQIVPYLFRPFLLHDRASTFRILVGSGRILIFRCEIPFRRYRHRTSRVLCSQRSFV